MSWACSVTSQQQAGGNVGLSPVLRPANASSSSSVRKHNVGSGVESEELQHCIIIQPPVHHQWICVVAIEVQQ